MNDILLLVPTQKELDVAAVWLSPETREDVHLCGFGPVEAGIETTRLLVSQKVSRVVLFGIAGTYDASTLPVGEAYSFEQVGIYGIGAGEGTGFRSAADLGFHTHPSETMSLTPVSPSRALLLTVTSASSNPDQVVRRRERFPAAVAEDMEAWSVALACARLGVSLTVIRGISNVAGERDHDGWQIDAALKSAAELLNSTDFAGS